jgi:hypothetical protein
MKMTDYERGYFDGHKDAFKKATIMIGGRVNCCICGKKIIGHGNNAQPLKKGICCDRCNIKVIIKRIKLIEKK